MRVVHVMASAERGGGARYLEDLLPRLRSHGIESIVVTGRNGSLGESLRELGFEVRYVNLMESRWSLGAGLALRGALKALEPDLLHFHGSRAGFYGALASLWGFGAARVYTAHGLAFRASQPLFNRLVRKASEALVCQLCHGVMSVSARDLERLEGLPRWGRWVGRYVPNAVDPARYQSPRDHARSLLGARSEACVVGTVSRLVQQKAVDVFLEAARALEAVNVVVVGDGPLRVELEAMVGEERNRFSFLGERSDVREMLAGLDVFVLSSAWEGEPLSLLEAMAAGVACVATDTPGSRAILAGGQAGLLVPVGDSGALRDAIMRLLEDGALKRELKNGAKRVLASRSIEAHAQLVVEVYGDSRAVAQGAE